MAVLTNVNFNTIAITTGSANRTLTKKTTFYTINFFSFVKVNQNFVKVFLDKVDCLHHQRTWATCTRFRWKMQNNEVKFVYISR